jgi:hypothetical protein
MPGISPAFAALVVRAMSQLPEQRPHGTGELQRQLTSVLQSVAAPAAPLVAPTPHPHEHVPDAPAPQPQHYSPHEIAAMLGMRLRGCA